MSNVYAGLNTGVSFKDTKLTSPLTGETYFDTIKNQVLIFNGIDWIPVVETNNIKKAKTILDECLEHLYLNENVKLINEVQSHPYFETSGIQDNLLRLLNDPVGNKSKVKIVLTEHKLLVS